MLKKFSKQISWLSVGVVFVVGLVARLNLINKSSLWYDEAFTGMMMKSNVVEILQQVIKDKVQPPLYYYALKIWVTIFGNTDTTLRLFSLVFGMALVIAAFVLIKKLFGTKAAIIASSLFALSPYFILYSIEARPYMMLGFEVFIAIYLFLTVYKKSFKNMYDLWKIKEFKILLALFILMAFTHFVGGVLVGVMCALLFFKVFPKYEKYFFAALLAILLIIVGRGLLNGGNFRIYDKSMTPTQWLPDGNLTSMGEMLYSFLFGVQSQALGKQDAFALKFINDMSTVFIVVLVLSIVIGINILRQKNQKLIPLTKLFLLSILVMTIICLFGMNLFIPRYLMFISIIFIVWIATYVSTLNTKAIIIGAIVYLALLTQVVWVNNNRYFGDQLSQLREESKTKRLVVQNSWDFLVLKYYLGEDSRNLFFYEPTGQQKKDPWLFFDKTQFIENVKASDIIL